MPLEAPPKSKNPIFQRMAADGVFGGGSSTRSRLQAGMDSTFANLRAPLPRTPVAGENVFGGGMDAGGVAAAAPSPLNVATGNIFGGGVPVAERNAATSATVPQQVAGVLSGLEDQGRVTAFENAVKSAGFNLDPTGQLPEEYQGALRGAQVIYDNIFGGGMPAGGGGGIAAQPSSTFAPTGLRGQAIAAGGAPVWGQGDVLASARAKPGGGTAFELMQASRVGGVPGMSSTPSSPIAPNSGLSRLPSSVRPRESAYKRNAQDFQNHIIAQQTKAGLSKGLEPGYMIDPDRPDAVKPIPGSMAEFKLKQAQTEMEAKANETAEAQRAVQEAGRQSIEKAQIVTKTINKILPQLNNLTTGPIAALTESVPGTPAYNVGKLKDTVVANIGLKELKAMKEASKTGASGMGALSEKELAVLETSLGNLKLAQDTKQVAQAMRDVRNSFYRWRATYKAGQTSDVERVNAVKWALAHEKDPRAERILALDDN